mmetsp:Transcript_19596/g.30179  ORF Transcript_19596/g.30179 Transcript_19596/m.30179 type:complete len:146 (+) Transcript_19596:2571-3008(+)
MIKASVDQAIESQMGHPPMLEPALEAAGWEEADPVESARVRQPKKLMFSSFGSGKPTRVASGQPTLSSNHPYQPDKMLVDSFDRQRKLKATKKRKTQGSGQARVHTQNWDAADRDAFGAPPPAMDAVELKNYFDLFTNSFGTKNP